ncbi:unnamed protein product [Spirodela intermedia]|uniref:Uncharacterized protein n=1 Tax=Spirodela intermedia TaxID=51605 RepID=A0A7I8IA57_SPIIN|nr:unnamed protein product [Spirodela intermedia]CAA6654606.1 unnamed protein product [Spirodela intermedia]
MVRCSPDLMPGHFLNRGAVDGRETGTWLRLESTPTLPLDGEPACRDKRIAHETAQHGT